MGVATIKILTPTGASGSAAAGGQAVVNNVAIVGGGAAMQHGHIAAAPAGGPNTPLKMAMVTITPSNSYATGGETCDFTVAGFDTVFAVIPTSLVVAGLLAEYDHTNSKLQVRQGAAANAVHAEVANASNQSANSFRALVIGT